MSKNEQKTFEIGLVLAGAISAGAYTAGVLDFLLEALENYEKVRRKYKEEFPHKPELHKVKIRVISGASAGGMCGTMLLSTLMDSSYKPMKNFDMNDKNNDNKENVFYNSWVSKKNGVDLEYFLNNEDISSLEDINKLESILNCEILDTISKTVINRFEKYQKKEYVSEELELLLSVFNLEGIDFNLLFQEETKQFYTMSNHADIMNFKLGKISDNPNKIHIDKDHTKNLELLRKSTLATGAFPIFLKPRTLRKNRDSYNKWRWWVPSNKKGECAEDSRCFSLLEPTVFSFPKEEYDFECVDGGVANNEPLELAQRILSNNTQFNERDKNLVNKAILMIDPFSETHQTPKGESKEGNFIIKKISQLLSGLKNQARFKPNELGLAMNPDIFSRFLIAPSKNDLYGDGAIASSTLGAFGGFFSEKFRQHDFQLGRKNAQSFLTKYFKIGVDNPLVKEQKEWFEENGCIIKEEDKQYFQVIPMVDFSKDENITYKIDPIEFEDIKLSQNELSNIYENIEQRVEFLADRYINRIHHKKFFVNLLIKIFRSKAKKELTNYLVKLAKTKINEELTKRNLIR